MNYLQTFEQTIEAITPFLLFVTAFGTFLAAIGSLAAASFTLKTVRQAEQSRRAQVLIEAAHRYNDVYVKRAELMKRNLTWDDFRQKYDTPIKRLTSSEWADLRGVAVAFEQMGVLVKNKLISSEMLFDTIFVDPAFRREDPATGKETKVSFWRYMSEIINEMRLEYNVHLWENWQYLVDQEQKYLENKERHRKRPRDASYSGWEGEHPPWVAKQ